MKFNQVILELFRDYSIRYMGATMTINVSYYAGFCFIITLLINLPAWNDRTADWSASNIKTASRYHKYATSSFPALPTKPKLQNQIYQKLLFHKLATLLN